MRTLGFVVGGVVVLGLMLGWVLDPHGRGSAFADRVRFTSYLLLRVYVAAICGWIAVRMTRHHDPFRLGLAALVGLMTVWSTFMAGVFAWGLLHPPPSEPE